MKRRGGEPVVRMEGITNRDYLRHLAAMQPGASDRAVAMLDGYVKAYDARQRYTGTPIASDAAVDAAYNGMIRRENERAGAFIRYITTAERGGLGFAPLVEMSRWWLDSIATAEPEKRAAARRTVLAAIARLEREAQPLTDE